MQKLSVRHIFTHAEATNGILDYFAERYLGICRAHWPGCRQSSAASNHFRARNTSQPFVWNAPVDAGVSNEEHPLAGLVGALGELIEGYDAVRYVSPDLSPANVLRELISQNDVKQSDFPKIASSGVISAC
ncbi:hypothetical protein [Burkholderia sp. S171]|uniref:hypothetical protein n=1 Tax=Burkholderia sp. S171 TaxID=1641860 RepID=UPI00131AFD58|nr:hypothetical protein [Burkholderia sp. S171]